MSALFSLRAKLFFRQFRFGLVIMLIWFAFGVFGFHRWEGLSVWKSIKVAFYLETPAGSFWDVYSFWGQCVLFVIVISVFLLQAFQQYNPQEVSRMLAKEMKDHAIVVGYTHLGSRIIEHFKEEGRPYVLIEKDETAVDDLIRQGEPVIVDNAKEPGTLDEAQIDKANLLVIASNNIETALLVTKKAREKNGKVRIIVRCYLDEFTEILESLGADEVISSSKSAFKELSNHLAPKA